MAAAIPLEGKLHAEFIRKASRAKGTVEYEFTEHLRMSGAYWGVAALSLLGEPFAEGAPNDGEDAFVEWVLSCQCAQHAHGVLPSVCVGWSCAGNRRQGALSVFWWRAGRGGVWPHARRRSGCRP